MEEYTPYDAIETDSDEELLWTSDAVLENARTEMPDYVPILTADHDLKFEEHLIAREGRSFRRSLPKTALTDMLLVGQYEPPYHGNSSNSPVYAFVYGMNSEIVSYTIVASDGNHLRLSQECIPHIAFQEPLCNIGEALKKPTIVCRALRAFILCRFMFAGYIKSTYGYETFWPDLERASKAIADSNYTQPTTSQSSVHALEVDKETSSMPDTNSSSAAATCEDQKTAVPQPEASKDKATQTKRKHDNVDDLNTSKITRREYNIQNQQLPTISLFNPPPPDQPLQPQSPQISTATEKEAEITELKEQNRALQQQISSLRQITSANTAQSPQQDHSHSHQDKRTAPYPFTFPPPQQNNSHHKRSTDSAADMQRFQQQHKLTLQKLLEQNGNLAMEHAEAVTSMHEAQTLAKVWKERCEAAEKRVGVLEAEMKGDVG